MSQNRQPTQLHILHDLGGGIAHWFCDYVAAESSYVHLALKPVFTENSFGGGLMLFVGTDKTPLQFWPFSTAISVLCTDHEEYRHALNEICQQHNVTNIIVSSLIGHSLDVLETSLPTLLITHDYFPACPAINAYFHGPCVNCGETTMRACAATNPADYNPFSALSANARSSLRQRFITTLTTRKLPLASPSISTRDRWLSLFPELSRNAWYVIPHGGTKLVDSKSGSTSPRSPGHFSVLLLGELSAPKGFHLIAEALSELRKLASIHFVGSGNLALFFSGQEGVTVIERYTLDELPTLIATIQPDLGLLASVCPETFSYTLSELAALGIPVLACRTGAFVDRIEDGMNGFLCDPTPTALIDKIRSLIRESSLLERARCHLSSLELRPASDMVADYRKILLPPPIALATPQTCSKQPSWLENNISQFAYLSRTQHQLNQRIEILQLCLSGRDRTIADINNQVDAFFQQRDSLTRQVVDLEHSLGELRKQLAMTVEQRVATEQHLATAQHHLQSVLTSTSWVITRPLRALVMLIRGEHTALRTGAKYHLFRFGRRIYWGLPARWRQPVVELAYALGGPLFHGLPDHARWLASRRFNNNDYIAADMIDIDSVETIIPTAVDSVAVHAHVYYPDTASEFARYLGNIPFKFDLLVSVPNEQVALVCRTAFSSLAHLNELIVEIVQNRGRDLAPLLCTFGSRIQKYTFVAHIHTKKSLYNDGRTTGWREYLLDGLLGSPERIRKILSLLQGPESFGMYYPQTFAKLPYQAHTWLANRAEGEIWCSRLGVGPAPQGYFDCPAGSMFWARVDAIRPLLATQLTVDQFPPESGQTDGTLAHTMERLLGIVPSHTGWKIAIHRDTKDRSWSKWRADCCFSLDSASIIERLSAPHILILAFDIFDTLLLRPLVDPEHTKAIVAARVGGQLGDMYLAERARVESLARTALGRDVDLDDIYTHWQKIEANDQIDLARLRSEEESVERSCVRIRPDIASLLQQLSQRGKTIVVASDTYLPRTLIEEMLADAGVSGWNALYLSGQIGKRKDDGSLFDHIQRDQGVAPSSMLMIGDSERSDFQIPADRGMQTFHILRPVEAARCLPRWSRLVETPEASRDLHWSLGLGTILRTCLHRVFHSNHTPNSMLSSAHDIGYAVVGPIITAFVQWVAHSATKDRIDHLYFLAREGELLHDVYQTLRRNGLSGPEASYLVLSRRSVTVPMIRTFDDVLALAETRFFANSLTMFMRERFGLELTHDDLNELSSQGIWRGGLVEIRDKNISEVEPVLQHLFPRIIEVANKERPAIVRYLQAMGLDSSNTNAVVDVGYSATIQSRLNRILDRPVHGYYMATTKGAGAASSNHDVLVAGCYGEELVPGATEPALFRQSFELEKMLSSDQHQVLHYDLDPTATTGVCPIFRTQDICDNQTLMTRAELRSGVRDFVDDIVTIRRDLLPRFEFPPRLAAQMFDAFVSNPSQQELDILRSIVLDDYYCGRGLVS